jgi:2Fe-2S ferredoxin
VKIVVIDHEGAPIEMQNPEATTLMAAIRDAGMKIAAQCGGSAACATCHVYVDETWLLNLSAIGDVEEAMLEFAENRQHNSRLSCQIELSDRLDGLIVTLAPGSAF